MERIADVFGRIARFRRKLDDAAERGILGRQYRVVIDGPLDRAIRVLEPGTSAPRVLRCFDSNSYLGLHLDRRVLDATRRVLDEAGYGTPSAQLLSGTNRWLRELEETVADFHGRPAALVFPSGYAANVGVLTALLRPGDAVVRDRFSHASIHDGVRFARVKHGGSHAHRDVGALERLLEQCPSAAARLVATDGVFSMHGTVAPLADVVRAARRHGARLLLDDAHGTGVLGPSGRGLEDHAGLPGAADILVGTFSKAPGSVGGYVVGSRDLVEYLRFHARPAVFTAALPAAICAGVTEAFRIMKSDPEPRERLWENARRFHQGLRQLGLTSAPLTSPIVAVAAGDDARLFALCRSLFDRGIKCGCVRYPAVPRDEGVLRFSISARHTPEDVDVALDALARAFRQVDTARRVA